MNILTSEKNHIRKQKNMNSIQKKIIKIASDLADEMIQSFEMTESEWEKYSELHPNAKKENHNITPDSQGKSKDSREVEMTDRQKEIHQRADDEDIDMRCLVACDPGTHPKTLEKLSNDKERFVRESVAANPSTHPKTLKKLSNDKERYVRRGVTENPRAPFEILEKLSNDEEYIVRRGVAENPNAHPKTLEKLSNDEKILVRRGVAGNPNAHPKTLHKLSNDKENIVRELAITTLKKQEKMN